MLIDVFAALLSKQSMHTHTDKCTYVCNTILMHVNKTLIAVARTSTSSPPKVLSNQSNFQKDHSVGQVHDCFLSGQVVLM